MKQYLVIHLTKETTEDFKGKSRELYSCKKQTNHSSFTREGLVFLSSKRSDKKKNEAQEIILIKHGIFVF